MDRIVIGLVGSLCSGKGTVADHLKYLGFSYEILSDRVREEARARGLEITRTILQDIGNELRETFGGQILVERTLPLIIDKRSNLVIDSIRNPDEIDYLRDVLGATIIGIDAPREIRLQWYLARAKERGEDGTTSEDFYRHDNRDWGIGEQSCGQQVKKCLEMADSILFNMGTKNYLYDECDSILKEMFNFDPKIHHSSIEKK